MVSQQQRYQVPCVFLSKNKIRDYRGDPNMDFCNVAFRGCAIRHVAHGYLRKRQISNATLRVTFIFNAYKTPPPQMTMGARTYR